MIDRRKLRTKTPPPDDAKPAPPAAEPAGVKQDIASLGSVLDLAGKVIGLTSVLAALLYYFGWARTQALYSHFGVDQTMLGFSTQDYVLRSLGAIWILLQCILAAVFVALWGDFFIERLLRKPGVQSDRLRRILAFSFMVLGPLLVALSMAANMVPAISKLTGVLFPSIAWLAGLSALAYGFYLYVRPRLSSSGKDREQAAGPDPVRMLGRVSLWLFGGLMLASLFWVVSAAAGEEGNAVAHMEIGSRFDAVVYSSRDLNLQAPGITKSQACQAADQCQYRYSGLKFLVRSGGKYFLLPAAWEESKRLTIVLPDDDSIRVELAPGPTPTPGP